MTNKYPGKCEGCGEPVARGTGILEHTTGRRRFGRWQVWCPRCFSLSDNSGPEDRACGDRAYEDECARRVNY